MPIETGSYLVDDNPPMVPNSAAPDAEGLSALAEPPDRMWIADIDDTKTENTIVTAQFNPEEFEKGIKVEWAKMKSPGLSHQRLQYVGTENPVFSFELTFDAAASGMTTEGITKAHSFLESLCYARRGATNIREGQAPRALFVWPNFLRLYCVVTDLTFHYSRFQRNGSLSRYVAKLKVEEVRDGRIYLEDVRQGINFPRTRGGRGSGGL